MTEDRNPAQDRRLTQGEIDRLKRAGIDVERLKDRTAGLDLFKDRAGTIYIKPKTGSGPGEETGLNMKDY